MVKLAVFITMNESARSQSSILTNSLSFFIQQSMLLCIFMGASDYLMSDNIHNYMHRQKTKVTLGVVKKMIRFQRVVTNCISISNNLNPNRTAKLS